MYYIIRTIIYIILVLLFTFIIIKLRIKSKKSIMNGSINEETLKKYGKFSYKLIFSVICSIVIFIIFNAVKFPVEQYFLTFDSEADAFNYYLIDNSSLDRYENDDSIFYVDSKDKNKIYALTNSNTKFSYLDYKSIDVNYDAVKSSYKDFNFTDINYNFVKLNVTAKYNKTNNITFYYIYVGKYNESANNKVTINDEPAKLVKTKNAVMPKTEIEYKKYYYTYFSEGTPYENIKIETDNKVSSFVKNS